MDARRISAATPLELLIINYELLLSSIEKAEKNINLSEELHLAQRLLHNLTISLDMEMELSSEILPLYNYVNKVLTDCQIKAHKKDSYLYIKKQLQPAKEVLTNLFNAVKTLPDIDDYKENPIENAYNINKKDYEG